MKKTKVLWLSVTPSLYNDNVWGHNGGGWISTLERIVREEDSVELGIAFEHVDDLKVVKKDVTYYPFNVWQKKKDRIKRRFDYSTEEKLIIPRLLKIIKDFKPDIIQVFGSEWCYGLVSLKTKIPVVIHMQGSIPVYYNARYPAGYSFLDQLFYNKFKLRTLKKVIIDEVKFYKRSQMEERVLKNGMYFLGRTHWDKAITKLYNSNRSYFYCSEGIRNDFFDTSKKSHNATELIISTTISGPIYKGGDLILKTAKILKDKCSFDFKWNVYGVSNLSFHEWKTGIKANEVNVNLKGIVSSTTLKNDLFESTIYVHPSYIENSPNSICEAQLIGLPVIATNVGGVSSLIEDKKTGFLMPTNDPFILANLLSEIYNNEIDLEPISKLAKQVAMVRHEPKNILGDLLSAYSQIIKLHKS